METVVAAVVGAVLAVVAGVLAERLRDRRAARAAARLIYAELASGAEQVYLVRQTTFHHYAVVFDSAGTELREWMRSLSPRFGDRAWFLAHLEDFVYALGSSGHDDLLEDFRSILAERFLAQGIAPDERLRREAWNSHAGALVRVADARTVTAVQRAYRALEHAAVVKEVEPAALTGRLFHEDVGPAVPEALRLLAPLAGVDEGALEDLLTGLATLAAPPTSDVERAPAGAGDL